MKDPRAEGPNPREPIAVRVVAFVSPQDGPGLNVASSCTARKSGEDNRNGHEIVYLPWMRHFRLDYCEVGKPKKTAFVHEQRVQWWEPLAL